MTNDIYKIRDAIKANFAIRELQIGDEAVIPVDTELEDSPDVADIAFIIICDENSISDDQVFEHLNIQVSRFKLLKTLGEAFAQTNRYSTKLQLCRNYLRLQGQS